jgi:signal transduction histidine kinase/CheY-like chemotaxis protein/HPt (histidine-containing phosphotransfer) domain-containing protein
VGFALIWLVLSRYDEDINSALENYRTESDANAILVSSSVQSKFGSIYETLRTIARMPGIRQSKSDQHALAEYDHIPVFELYRNLSKNVQVSEIYVVHQNFNPDRLDRRSGRPEEPAMMFDEELMLDHEHEPHPDSLKQEVRGVEIFEYHEIHDQIESLRKLLTVDQSQGALVYPFVASREVITCDERNFDHKHPDDDARKGIVLSVPFYDQKGRFSGVISAIVLTSAIRSWLPLGEYALDNPERGYSVGEERVVRLARMRNGYKGIYHQVARMSIRDLGGEWRLLVNKPDAVFRARNDVRAATRSAEISIVLVGALLIALVIALDILRRNMLMTERKKAELQDMVRERTAELELTVDALEIASRAKSSFLAMMSHEIRTPMNGVVGMTSVLMDTPLNEDQRRATFTIRDSAESLLRIINDILDYSKLEAGAVDVETVNFDLHALINYSIEIVQTRVAAKSVILKADICKDVPHFIRTDAGRLRQIILNLMGNAVKFTARGSVTLRVTAPGGSSGATHLRVEVIDTGIGIPADKLPQMFKSFSQADASIARRFGGTGLGLSISKMLVERLGGQIGVTSEIGKGSTFFFEVPVETCSEEDLPKAASLSAEQLQAALARLQAAERPIRVLVAEDNTTNQLVAKLCLEKFGFKPDFVANGLEAIEAVKAVVYDFVFMDMHMPEMDGLEASLAIRRLPGECSRVPIIALTANVFSEDVEAYRAAGMNGCVGKPFRQEELILAMAAVQGGENGFDSNHIVPATAYAPTGATPADVAPIATPRYLDLAVLEEFGESNGEDMVHMLVDNFVETTVAALNDLKKMIGDAAHKDEMKRIVHSLKSAGGFAGAPALSDLARSMEKAIVEGRLATMDECRELETCLAQYQEALARSRFAA